MPTPDTGSETRTQNRETRGSRGGIGIPALVAALVVASGAAGFEIASYNSGRLGRCSAMAHTQVAPTRDGFSVTLSSGSSDTIDSLTPTNISNNYGDTIVTTKGTMPQRLTLHEGDIPYTLVLSETTANVARLTMTAVCSTRPS